MRNGDIGTKHLNVVPYCSDVVVTVEYELEVEGVLSAARITGACPRCSTYTRADWW